MLYEFYIYSNDGDDVWHWDLKEIDQVIKDIKENKKDDSFSVDVLTWLSENNCLHTEIYPSDKSLDLPEYVKKEVNRVLKGVDHEI